VQLSADNLRSKAVHYLLVELIRLDDVTVHEDPQMFVVNAYCNPTLRTFK
jgi:hypothetical protein